MMEDIIVGKTRQSKSGKTMAIVACRPDPDTADAIVAFGEFYLPAARCEALGIRAGTRISGLEMTQVGTVENRDNYGIFEVSRTPATVVKNPVGNVSDL